MSFTSATTTTTATSNLISIVAFIGSATMMVVSQTSIRHGRRKYYGNNDIGKKYFNSSSSSSSTTTSNKTKDDILQLRQKYISKNVSLSYLNSGSLMILQGQGNYLIDENNVSYLDTRNNVAHVGHCNPHVVHAIQRQISILNTNTRYLHPTISLLSEKLISIFQQQPTSTTTETSESTKTKSTTSPLEVVIFVNSGSEANDLALRIARACNPTSKNTIVVDRACKYENVFALYIYIYLTQSLFSHFFCFTSERCVYFCITHMTKTMDIHLLH